jgi:hypothetical protein
VANLFLLLIWGAVFFCGSIVTAPVANADDTQQIKELKTQVALLEEAFAVLKREHSELKLQMAAIAAANAGESKLSTPQEPGRSNAQTPQSGISANQRVTQTAPATAPPANQASGAFQGASSSVVSGDESAVYWITSTGKRHISRCRYFKRSKGREGVATEGEACKICGG